MQPHSSYSPIHPTQNRATATAEGVGKLEEALMPCQGRQDTMVDRFDARTVMEHIGEYEAKERPEGKGRVAGER